MRRALVALDESVDVVDWDDPTVDWSRFRAAVIRSTWNYQYDPTAFLAWVRRAAEVTRVVNPPDVVTWNLDKRYLNELRLVGFPVIDTTFITTVNETAFVDLGGDVVVKPTVSAGSNDTGRYRGDANAARAHVTSLLASGRVAMVQPYDPDIDALAETGVVCVGGEVSHAFAKSAILAGALAAHNGLFVEETIVPRQPVPVEVELANAVLKVLSTRFGAPLAYARIDMVGGSVGRPRIMEVELIEPSLFVETDPRAAERVARAFVTAAGPKAHR